MSLRCGILKSPEGLAQPGEPLIARLIPDPGPSIPRINHRAVLLTAAVFPSQQMGGRRDSDLSGPSDRFPVFIGRWKGPIWSSDCRPR